MEDRLPRKLAAILYADVAGYSRLIGEDEDATHRTLSEYLDLLTSTIESHRGQVMHYAGDAVLAKFDAVVDAMSAALAIQSELKARNAKVPEARKVQFRIGVNSGDVIEDRGDIYGDSVNVAARLESLAEPGGICISDAVRSAVGKKLNLDYGDMGEQEVKNIAEPVRAYRVVFHSESGLPSHAAAALAVSPPQEHTIAVLAFDSLNGDSDDGYFVDGLVEDIITALSKSPGLLVISRNSTFVYKGKAVDARKLGQALGARYLMEGSVRKSRTRVRVTVQLIDAADGHHLWAERYDRELTDIFAVQDEIVESVTGILGGTHGKLDQIARVRAMRKETGSLEAYDCFLRGREYMNRYRVRDEEFGRAKEMFEQAIELDPRFARAYLGLAWYHHLRSKWGVARSPDESLRLASELVHEAVRLDTPDYWGQRIVGVIALTRREFGEARRHLDRALAQNPNDAQLLANLTDAWCYMGRAIEAIELGRRAMRLNPNYPDWYPWVLAFAHFTARQYPEALELLQEMLNPEARRLLAATYAKLGQLEVAKETAEEFLRYNPSFSIRRWAEAEPYEDQGALEDYVDGLRKAGFPD